MVEPAGSRGSAHPGSLCTGTIGECRALTRRLQTVVVINSMQLIEMNSGTVLSLRLPFLSTLCQSLPELLFIAVSDVKNPPIGTKLHRQTQELAFEQGSFWRSAQAQRKNRFSAVSHPMRHHCVCAAVSARRGHTQRPLICTRDRTRDASSVKQA